MFKKFPWEMLFFLVMLALVCAGLGTCKKWQYDECIKVGHGEAFCVADTAGCFNGGKGKKGH